MGGSTRSVRDRVTRRVRRSGGRLIRRFALLPDGDPDGLGQDEALRGQSLPFTVLVYFPDTARNLYQLRQWYAPLRALDAAYPVGIITLDSRTAAVVRAESGLPVMCVGRIGTLEDLVSRSDVALALYVNHNIRNLHPLRFPTMLHAYLGHGDSDKAASASNQVKAYDFVLVAGRAGQERLRRNLLRYDVDAHVRTVGRPQLDVVAGPAARPTGARPTVLYAPTWEGAQPSMGYGSVASHGEAVLGSLLGSGEFDVVYRPHPRTGANQVSYAAADMRLRALVGQAQQSDLSGRHRVDLTPDWDAAADPADLLVCDVSAVAGDWMSTGRPLVVTVPVSPDAALDGDSMLEVVPTLTVLDAPRTADVVRQELATGGDAAGRAAWVHRAMGDVSPGAATARFLEVCEDLVALRGQELEMRAQRRGGSTP